MSPHPEEKGTNEMEAHNIQEVIQLAVTSKVGGRDNHPLAPKEGVHALLKNP